VIRLLVVCLTLVACAKPEHSRTSPNNVVPLAMDPDTAQPFQDTTRSHVTTIDTIIGPDGTIQIVVRHGTLKITRYSRRQHADTVWRPTLRDTVQEAPTQSPALESTIRLASSGAVPPTVVAGVVILAHSGQILPGALVYLDGTHSGAVVDERGHFHFEAPRPGSYRLVAKHIGYDSASAQIGLESDRGVLAQIGLEHMSAPNCEDALCGAPAVCGQLVAEIRDILTGRAPLSAVHLQLRGPGMSDSIVAAPTAAEAFVLRTPLKLPRPESLSIDMHAEGYLPWHSTVRQDCGISAPSPIRVWLFPR
jgi:hypothetical protein